MLMHLLWNFAHWGVSFWGCVVAILAWHKVSIRLKQWKKAKDLQRKLVKMRLEYGLPAEWDGSRWTDPPFPFHKRWT